MSNGSDSPPARAGLAPLLFAAGALVVYFLLISRWQGATPPTSAEQQGEARKAAPQLELSRRLSTPTGNAEVPPRGAQKSWLLPLAAFFPPLLIGVLWGGGRVSGRDKDLVFSSGHLRIPDAEIDTGTTSGGGPGRGAAPLVDDESASATVANVSAASAISNDGNGAPGPDAANALAAPESVAESMAESESDVIEDLRAALRARDEVIAALEEIVRENRENWSEREVDVNSQAQTIATLQAELDAATEVIELLQMSDDDRRHERSPRPQVLQRNSG